MPNEAYCVTYRENRWSVLLDRRDLGSFYFRTDALKFAITAANLSGRPSRWNVYVLDRGGDFYTAWNGDTDIISLDP